MAERVTEVANPIGGEIRRLREEMGMTLHEFGRHTGIPWQTLQGYESGRMEPSAARLLHIVHKTRRAGTPFRFEQIARAVVAQAA